MKKMIVPFLSMGLVLGLMTVVGCGGGATTAKKPETKKEEPKKEDAKK